MYFGFEKPCVLEGQIRAVGSPACASRYRAPEEWHKIGHQYGLGKMSGTSSVTVAPVSLMCCNAGPIKNAGGNK